ncbi:MAG: hypothetical protein SGJ24_11910 [Chloroflexota bacterium]|nr:hypothetical protein [Chloroflexota bacterium]
MLHTQPLHPVRRIVQEDWYCGPTTLAMLYSAFGIAQDPEAIAIATGVRDTIFQRGCRTDNLADAVQALTPDFVLLGKYDSSIADLHRITTEWGLPVGVEWRGTFLEPNGHLWHEGHYSVVAHVNTEANAMRLIDPFNGVNTAHQDGVIAIDAFQARWWDENYFPAPDSAHPTDPDTWTDHVWTEGAIFALIPKSDAAPLVALGMAPLTVDLPRHFHHTGRQLDPTLSYRPDDMLTRE